MDETKIPAQAAEDTQPTPDVPQAVALEAQPVIEAQTAGQQPEPARPETVTVADIRFRNNAKTYFFDPGVLTLAAGDHVIIDTSRGVEFGICTAGNHEIPAAEVVANVRKIVERFQSESPRTKLYVQSVFPVNDSFKKYAAKHGRHDADIVAVNKGLQALCAEKGIVYIDLWTLLADKNGKLRADLTNDGLHLMGEGYIVWRDAVLPYVK